MNIVNRLTSYLQLCSHVFKINALIGYFGFVVYKSFETLLLPDENLGLNKNLEKFEKGSVLIKYVLGPGFNKFGLKNFVDRILDNIIFSNYLVEI